MAETTHPGAMAATVAERPRERAERQVLFWITASVLVWLALALGLGALFSGLGDTGAWIVRLLPFAVLAVAALGLRATLPAGGLRLDGNRLRSHVIGWGIAAMAMLVLAVAGGLLSPVLGLLGKTGPIIEGFTRTNGLFFAALFAVIAAMLAAIGASGKLETRHGAFERAFVHRLTAKIAAVPMILVALVVFTGGTVWTVIYSFTDSKLLPRERWIGLEQYERLWGESRWIISIENLMIYGICALIFSLTIGFCLAVLLDQKIRFENTFRTIFLYPFALSFIVTGLVWQWILNPEFGIQRIIRASWIQDIWSFLGGGPISFDPLYNQDIVIYGILIAGVWHGTGLIMCLMLAGLRGIDQEIWKAARVDGIPAWKTYLFIIIPMMRPVFITTLVIIASGIVRLYDLVVAQTSGGPGIASEVPAKYVYDKMFLGQNLGQGFAASTMMLITVLIVLIPWAYLEFGGKKRG
jgi:glucose/mannose transport system permease protein